jgi:hypothetical protein
MTVQVPTAASGESSVLLETAILRPIRIHSLGYSTLKQLRRYRFAGFTVGAGQTEARRRVQNVPHSLSQDKR